LESCENTILQWAFEPERETEPQVH
jgi:hypothetical protein